MDEFDKLIADDKLTLADFFATWCAPCKAMHGVIEILERSMAGRINIVKLDIDAPRNAALTLRYRITSVPTLMLFRRGEIRWRGAGLVGAEYLTGIINRFGQPQEA